MYKNLIFDLDDTLLVCGTYYKECKDKFVEYAHKRTGIEKHIIDKMHSGVDLACMSLDNGFGKERFPRSFAAVSAVLDIIRGLEIDEKASQMSYLIGDAVFTKDYPLFPKTLEVLDWCKAQGFNIFLYTKGDYQVQLRKVHINGLDKYFDMSHIYIVDKKDSSKIEQIMFDHVLSTSNTIVIGDSVQDDIGSAVGAGIACILVQHPNKEPWYYEQMYIEPNRVITDIEYLSEALEDIYAYARSTTL